MNTISDTCFQQQFDRDSGRLFEDLQFLNCTFDNCGLSMTASPELRSVVRNVRLTNCTEFNSHLGPAILEDVHVEDLVTSDLFIIWGALFRRVTLKGKIGRIKVNSWAHPIDWSEETQGPFDRARDAFYQQTDWALDIRDAAFLEFEAEGIPLNLILRDPLSQAILRRQNIANEAWRNCSCSYWVELIDAFMGDECNATEMLLVAPKRRRNYRELARGLRELRDLGVVD